MWEIEYKPVFGGTVTRSFLTYEDGETWCRQIGRKDLIQQLDARMPPSLVRLHGLIKMGLIK